MEAMDSLDRVRDMIRALTERPEPYVRELPPVLYWAATLNPYTYGVDLLKHALLAGDTGADFSVPLDLAVLAAATVVSAAVASWRFSRESAYEPMIHVPAGRAR